MGLLGGSRILGGAGEREAEWNGSKTELVSSPRVISSTLITSAPRSASNIVAVGPASTRVRSTTLRPRKGGSMAARGRADGSSLYSLTGHLSLEEAQRREDRRKRFSATADIVGVSG